MPRSIPNSTVSSVAYTDALTFAGTDIFEWGYVTVANNPVFAQLLEGILGQANPQDEQYLPPATYPIVSKPDRPIAGIRFRAVSTNTPLPQVFGNLYYPQDPGIQAGTPFTGIVSPTGAVGVGVGVLDRDTSFIDTRGSAAEIAVYSFLIPGGTMAIDSMLRLTMIGDVLNNRAIADTIIHRVRWGGTVSLAGAIIAQDNPVTSVLSANVQPWNVHLELPNLGATNSQTMAMSVDSVQPDAAAPAVGIGGIDWRNDFLPEGGYMGLSVPVAQNTTVDNLLEVTIQNAVASAALGVRKRFALLEIL